MPTTTIALSIEGMTCGHCVKAVKQALESVPGIRVKDVSVGAASIETDESPAPLDAIKDAVEDAGYFAEASSS